jgi:hypothetical protein
MCCAVALTSLRKTSRGRASSSAGRTCFICRIAPHSHLQLTLCLGLVSMEFALRCNDLKCRAQLHDNAVVTTCRFVSPRRCSGCCDTDCNSHVFCTQCADTTGLSRSTNTHRTCPACGASLHNPDDVVVAGLNPSEDYKTSILSGLSPTIIMECASRGLAFHSYQTSQEIIYQEHLAKGLTEKYNTLSQQMDQLIHDANAQIKALQDKMEGEP